MLFGTMECGHNNGPLATTKCWLKVLLGSAVRGTDKAQIFRTFVRFRGKFTDQFP
jgi:hypothetical protein